MCTAYDQDYSDPRWLRVRADVIERDKQCAQCGAKLGEKKQLVAHHKAYVLGKEQWDHPLDLLVCMCQNCHSMQPKSPVFHTVEEAREYLNPRPIQLEWHIIDTGRKGVTGYRYAALSAEQNKILEELVLTTGLPSTTLLQIAAQKLLWNKDRLKNCHTREEILDAVKYAF